MQTRVILAPNAHEVGLGDKALGPFLVQCEWLGESGSEFSGLILRACCGLEAHLFGMNVSFLSKTKDSSR